MNKIVNMMLFLVDEKKIETLNNNTAISQKKKNVQKFEKNT